MAASAFVGAAVAAGVAFADPEAPATAGVCQTVAHVGDSTSVGMIDTAVIPEVDQQAGAQYKSLAGVSRVLVDAVGGRAIVEQVGEASPGVEAVRTLAQNEHPDCWVIALGTNDAGNVAAGSVVDAATRIDKVMSEVGDKPVVWPTVKTTAAADGTPFAPASMTVFNDALTAAQAKYPNLRVLDWAATATDADFYEDGIHYTVDGTKKRILAFADAIKEVSLSGAATSTSVTPSTTEPAVVSTPAETEVPATSTVTETVTETPAPVTVTETATVTVAPSTTESSTVPVS